MTFDKVWSLYVCLFVVVFDYLKQVDIVDLSLEEEVVDSKHFIPYKIRET